jgi:hypothetical protein
MSNIIQHLKNRLLQRNLHQQVTRSKAVTPILDAIAEAAKLEGISADEIVSDFVTGKYAHPVINAALGKPSIAKPAAAPLPTAAMLAEREKARRSVSNAPRPKPPALPARPAVKAAAPPAPRPHIKESTGTLVAMLKRNLATPTERISISAELAQRNVVIHAKGFSTSHINRKS